MRVYHDFVLVPGSKSTFPDTDPDPDPAKWYGSDRIRIRNTGFIRKFLSLNFFSNNDLFLLSSFVSFKF